ncbi:hypothetical protein F3Y22_tig00110607pilonHSYRG00324 [Hibiscus syriacus]|uniref:Uncharacterized protein n=1 Tax=Hibiscus syriacus TaxID=106335 RepID=A0A6A3A442_HIBSY|nr:vegetative cell wall protein gp1-like [Hibiscus syriacus]KAE8698015.1 hypothetical protein F3Y22_tig00110607pilonHSYRG00324 [Hibiscus syriacus]
MSNQQAPTRPWFRLASISRPTPQAPTPTPEPAPALPRSTTIRPAFRPTGGASSVPPSPVSVGRGSQPSSPSDKKPTTEVSSTTASVPNSPVQTPPTVSRSPAFPPKPAKTSSLQSSPAKSVATTVSVPSSPAKPVGNTTASVPTSPAKTASTTTSLTNFPKTATFTTATNRVASPQASVPTTKPAMQSPVQSPKIKPPTAPPPSPLTLPPPQMRAQADHEPKIPVEAEQKTVLVQKMIDKPKGLFSAPQKDLEDTRYPSIHGQKEPSKHGETKEKGNGKKLSLPSDSEDSGMRVITIAGENKGAFMELIKSPHRNGFQNSPHRLQKTATGSSDEYHSYSSSGEEGDRKTKGKNIGSNTMPMNAFMNSNVQGVNNSIVYNSSCTHHDPGVHLSLHRKPTAGGFPVKERSNGYNS